MLNHKVDHEHFEEELKNILIGMSARDAGTPNPIQGSSARPF